MKVVKLSTSKTEKVNGHPIQPALIYRSIQLKGIEFIIRGQIDSVSENLPQQLPPNQRNKSKSSQENLNDVNHSVVLCRTFVDIPSSLRKQNIWENIEQRHGAIFLGKIK